MIFRGKNVSPVVQSSSPVQWIETPHFQHFLEILFRMMCAVRTSLWFLTAILYVFVHLLQGIESTVKITGWKISHWPFTMIPVENIRSVWHLALSSTEFVKNSQWNVRFHAHWTNRKFLFSPCAWHGYPYVVNPLPTIMHNCNVYVEAIIIMSGTVLRTCCKFCIISPIVKKL